MDSYVAHNNYVEYLTSDEFNKEEQKIFPWFKM